MHISASSSEKGLYYKSMMWHSMCKFFGSFFEKFSNQRDFKEFSGSNGMKDFEGF